MGAGVLAARSLRVGKVADDSAARVVDPRDELLLQEGAELVSGLTGPFAEVKRSHDRAPSEVPPPPAPEGDDG
jgi:hypothetical protein